MPIVSVPYFCIKEITDPCQKRRGYRHFSGKARVQDIVPLSTKENLRDYLAGLDPAKKHKIHKAIEGTLLNEPDLFSMYNSGATICAVAGSGLRSSGSGILRLDSPSVMDGAQSRGSIENALLDLARRGEGAPEAYITFQLFLLDDEEVTANMTVNLNRQIPVQLISVANAKGVLDDLQREFRKKGMKIRLRESDPLEEGMVDTEKLVRVIGLLTPAELWSSFWKRQFKSYDGGLRVMKKASIYSTKTRSLKDFAELYMVTKDPSHPKHKEAKALYRYYVDIATTAWDTYCKWKRHQLFADSKHTGPKKLKGKGRPVKKDRDGNVVDVADGFVFPCLATLALYVVKEGGKWTLGAYPRKAEALIKSSLYAFQEDGAHSKPDRCGREQKCYNRLARELHNGLYT
jgi:hypothetical protein